MFDLIAKERMLRRHLRGRGISDARVLQAMADVPRELFVPAELGDEAYADRALPIDCEQTISQPYIVALMSQGLELNGNELVLEVGTGSGYQTAILSALASEVVSIERHAALSQQAGRRLSALGCTNVSLIVGDGTRGWPSRAPYDRIIVTAAAAVVPPPLFEQLAEVGRMVMPVGAGDHQLLQAIQKQAGALHTTILSACRFVPLIAEPAGRKP